MKTSQETWIRTFFIEQSALKKINQVWYDLARYRASAISNIRVFLNKLKNFIKIRNYSPDCILQIDETSCMVHAKKKISRVVSAEVRTFPLLSIPTIFHITVTFIVNAMGEHLQTQVIIPESYDLSAIKEYLFPCFQIHRTQKGWMEKSTFTKIMEETVIEEMKRIRRTHGREEERILLLMDGHSSRMNRELWERFHRERIDVIVIPAHTSHILQPLDLGVNGEFKRALEQVPAYPQRSELKEKLPQFFLALNTAIYTSLNPDTIRHGFSEACILGKGKKIALSKCIPRIPEYLLPKRSYSRFSINSHLLTDPVFLRKWKDYEGDTVVKFAEESEVEKVDEWEKMNEETDSEDRDSDDEKEEVKYDEENDPQVQKFKKCLSLKELEEMDTEEGERVLFLKSKGQDHIETSLTMEERVKQSEMEQEDTGEEVSSLKRMKMGEGKQRELRDTVDGPELEEEEVSSGGVSDQESCRNFLILVFTKKG
jgi:hypothetical protein